VADGSSHTTINVDIVVVVDRSRATEDASSMPAAGWHPMDGVVVTRGV
jgi:hypothetical protein